MTNTSSPRNHNDADFLETVVPAGRQFGVPAEAISETPGPTEEDRERYRGLLDSALARELIDDSEYVERMASINRATSLEEMNSVVQEMPIISRAASVSKKSARRSAPPRNQFAFMAPAPSTADPTVRVESVPSDEAPVRPEPAFYRESPADDTPMDAVDLARLASRAKKMKAPSASARYVALIAIAVLFLALIVLGVVLASHTHATSSGVVRPNGSEVALGMIARSVF